MSEKQKTAIYFLSTGILTLFLLSSTIWGYFMKTALFKDVFESLGYPRYLVLPLGVVKIIGLLSLWFISERSIKEWTYAGFFFVFLLAFLAHHRVNDSSYFQSISALILLFASYVSCKTIHP